VSGRNDENSPAKNQASTSEKLIGMDIAVYAAEVGI
jgi:hypothetical protein